MAPRGVIIYQSRSICWVKDPSNVISAQWRTQSIWSFLRCILTWNSLSTPVLPFHSSLQNIQTVLTPGRYWQQAKNKTMTIFTPRPGNKSAVWECFWTILLLTHFWKNGSTDKQDISFSRWLTCSSRYGNISRSVPTMSGWRNVHTENSTRIFYFYSILCSDLNRQWVRKRVERCMSFVKVGAKEKSTSCQAN